MPDGRFGFVVTQENVEAVMMAPTSDQQQVIHQYVRVYREAHGFAPHGLHYLPGLVVWLPPPEEG